MDLSDPNLWSTPDLTIVVAAWPDDRGLAECLAALVPQLNSRTEVLIAGRGDSGVASLGHPQIRRLVEDRGLIPDRWAAGIRAARGRVVAITTAHFRPDPDWVSSIRAAHGRLDSAGIGGPIDPPSGPGPVGWATYFLRYSAYFDYDREQDVPDLAGDNASYKRAVIEEYPELLQNGFWELDFHRRVRASGRRLTFVPSIRVALHHSFGFFCFLRQRFKHGVQFGSARFQTGNRLFRLAAIAAAPIIPVILICKTAARAIRGRQSFGAFMLSLPVLACFVMAWASGEVYGYLNAGRRMRMAFDDGRTNSHGRFTPQ